MDRVRIRRARDARKDTTRLRGPAGSDRRRESGTSGGYPWSVAVPAFATAFLAGVIGAAFGPIGAGISLIASAALGVQLGRRLADRRVGKEKTPHAR